ncbi:TetR family transcriptional regulator [Demequina sp. SO4-18]|uniref:TetR family transcriptional regulator n=1 Tax=Demequina sp. SO4-18 TaxID=3401026 RepID=UPI003B5C162D
MEQRRRPTSAGDRRAATHAELLSLGVARFPVKGYSATSIEDVLRGTHHSKGSFYHHFASKEAYFLAVMRRRGEMMEETWQRLDRDVETLADGLAAAGVWLDDDEGSLPDTLLLAEFRFAAQGKPALLAELAGLYERWIDQLTVLLELLAARDLIRTDRSPRDLASSVYHLTDGYVVHAAVFGSDVASLRPDLIRLLAPA